MSITVFWRPVGPVSNTLALGAPSMFTDMLERAFGELPIKLTSIDLQVLQGMKFGSTDSYFRDAFKELQEAIEQHSEIEVSVI